MASAAAKKATTKAAKKSASTPASHPPYKNMIKKAISELKERGGSSRIAIVKYIGSNFKVSDNNAVLVKQALRRMVANKELVHASAKSHGANGSFKLPAKETKAAKPKKAAAAASPKKASPKKPQVKSAAKPKSPKKSPAKKVAKNSVAKK